MRHSASYSRMTTERTPFRHKLLREQTLTSWDLTSQCPVRIWSYCVEMTTLLGSRFERKSCEATTKPLGSTTIGNSRSREMTPKSDALSFTNFCLQCLFGQLANVDSGKPADDQWKNWKQLRFLTEVQGVRDVLHNRSQSDIVLSPRAPKADYPYSSRFRYRNEWTVPGTTADLFAMYDSVDFRVWIESVT